MIELELERVDWAPPREGGVRHAWAPAPPADARILEPDTIVTLGGNPSLLHLAAPRALGGPSAFLLEALRTVRWDGTLAHANEFRLSGFNNAHRTFGFSAPQPLRRRYGCAPCSFDREYGAISRVLAELGAGLAELFDRYAPSSAAAHRALLAGVGPDWHFGAAPWTSGIINCAAALPYHRDSGNLVGTWSGMLVVRERGSAGGLLHVPEFDVWLDLPDRSIVLFDGQGAWHGVTPLAGSGLRYSAVWYAKAMMRECAPLAEEWRRAARAATR